MASIVPSERLRRERDRRQGSDAHACAGGAGDRLVPAWTVGARRRGGTRGSVRRTGRLEVDGQPDLHRHARALPGLVRQAPGRARPRLPVPRRCLPEAAARRHAGRGRAGRLGRDAGGARKVLLGLQLGSRESYEDWLDFGRDLLARGARPPALIIADGAPGLWKAARELWPAALEQRCTVHALRNVTKKLPEQLHRELKARYWRILDEATSPAEARVGLLALVADYRASYPSA